MMLLKSYRHVDVYDYNAEMRDFLSWLCFSGLYKKHAVTWDVFEDDGSYFPPSGTYVELAKDDFYCSCADLIRAWKMARLPKNGDTIKH